MALPKPSYSVQDYLADERTSAIKHEYWQGEVFAMAGASLRHNHLCANMIGVLRNHLRGKGCIVLSSDQRLRVSATRYVYPDVQVVCGKPETDADNPPSLLNPTVVVEVTSPSTESYDRDEKSFYIRQLASVQHYLVVAQDRVYVQHYSRLPDGAWRLLDLLHMEASLELADLGIAFPLSELYDGVEFESNISST